MDCAQKLNTMKVEVKSDRPEKPDVEVTTKEESDKEKLDALKFRMNQQFHTDMFSTCDSVEEVREVFRQLVADTQAQREKEPDAPSGTMPLPSGYNDRNKDSGFNQPFANTKEMLKYLRKKESEGSPSERAEAKRILTEFYRKFVRENNRRRGNIDISIPESERETIKEE